MRTSVGFSNKNLISWSFCLCPEPCLNQQKIHRGGLLWIPVWLGHTPPNIAVCDHWRPLILFDGFMEVLQKNSMLAFHVALILRNLIILCVLHSFINHTTGEKYRNFNHLLVHCTFIFCAVNAVLIVLHLFLFLITFKSVCVHYLI